MRIGIIGGGTVGRATARSYLEHHDVLIYDKDPTRSTASQREVLRCDLVFICLPTPPTSVGERALSYHPCDTGIIEEFLAGMQNVIPPTASLVLKSTVPVGFTSRMSETHNLPNLVHSPEFLTARCSVVDAHLPSRNIIGAPGHKLWPPCAVKLERLYKSRFKGVPIYRCTSDESEAVKLFQNAFFATKISFFNLMYEFCDRSRLSFEDVKAMLLADGRIAHSHTTVPGPDGKLGFGGECLPKDLDNLIQCCIDSKLWPTTLRAVVDYNQGLKSMSECPNA